LEFSRYVGPGTSAVKTVSHLNVETLLRRIRIRSGSYILSIAGSYRAPNTTDPTTSVSYNEGGTVISTFKAVLQLSFRRGADPGNTPISALGPRIQFGSPTLHLQKPPDSGLLSSCCDDCSKRSGSLANPQDIGPSVSLAFGGARFSCL